MTEYVISHRRAAGAAPRAAALRDLITEPGPGVTVRRMSPMRAGRQIMIVEATRAAAARLRSDDSLIVEPLVDRRHHRPALTQLTAPAAATKAAAAPSGPPQTLDVTLNGPQGGVAGIEVTLVLQPIAVQNQTTAASGTCSFDYPASASPSSLSTSACAGYWTIADTTVASPATLGLPQISPDGPLAWWQHALGQAAFDANRGRGIRIGIVDTGLGPNACLAHATVVGSIIGGQFDPSGGADNDGHGTLIAGLIGSRPVATGNLAGVAPGVELFAIRVFPPNGGANQADVAAAIDMLVDDYQVDLINLSLTGSKSSTLERDAIAHAYQQGTLCICAAGNDASVIRYPAAYPEAVAVSAIGLQGWGPPGSIASQMPPSAPDMMGEDGLYLAPFSASGQGLECCAPGLGIISTWPGASATDVLWGEDSGTSLAAPLALATLATTLAASANYRDMERTQARSDLARSLLAGGCRSIGLAETYEGKGMPVSA